MKRREHGVILLLDVEKKPEKLYIIFNLNYDVNKKHTSTIMFEYAH